MGLQNSILQRVSIWLNDFEQNGKYLLKCFKSFVCLGQLSLFVFFFSYSIFKMLEAHIDGRLGIKFKSQASTNEFMYRITRFKIIYSIYSD